MDWIVASVLTVIIPFIILSAFICLLFLPKFSIWALYLHVSVITALVVWVGLILSLLGWVWPKLTGSETTSTSKEKIVSAAIAAVLLYVGKQLLELRQVRLAQNVLQTVVKNCFRKRVPDTLLEGSTGDTVERLAYRALYVDEFVAPNRFVVKGWGPRASSFRIKLVEQYIRSRKLRP